MTVKFDENIGQKSLDPLLEFLIKNLNDSKTIKIGDYIIHKMELDLLQKHYEVNQNTVMNIFTLFDMIYPIRSKKYYHDISAGFERFMNNSTGSLGPMFLLSKSVIRDHTGNDDVEKDASLAVMLSVILYKFFNDVAKYCVEKLK